MKIVWIAFFVIALLVLTGCSSGKSNIKNNFCGLHIDYRYCKCAFHNNYCNEIGMSKSEANTYVYSEYNKWIESKTPKEKPEEEKYGVIEKDGKLYLNSKPGEILQLKTEDLPKWAIGKIATVGMMITVVGPPDTIKEGDEWVTLDGLPIARMGDGTAHGGAIINGSENIFVNGKPVALIGGFAVDPTVLPGPVPSIGGQIVDSTGK